MLARSVLLAVSILVTTVFFFNSSRVRASIPPSLSTLRTLSTSDFSDRVRILASELLEGRAPSTRGGELAAEYLASQLLLLGYRPAGDEGTYFQRVPLIESEVGPETRVQVGARILRALSEMVAFSGSIEPRVRVEAEVVFVGYGIVAPEYEWDDYAGADIRGKVVLVQVGEPRSTGLEPSRFAGDALTYYGRWTYKIEEAARRGAAGVLLIHSDEGAMYPWGVVQSSWGGRQLSLRSHPDSDDVPFKAWLTGTVAEELVASVGRSLHSLVRAAEQRGARPIALGVKLRADLVRTVRHTTSPNVIGVLRGEEPGHSVLLTAHYDHLGRAGAGIAQTGEDRTFNGAIDNASGVAGALALAGAFAAAPRKPRQSIYVMFTTGEESGLLGSRFFVGHPVVPLDRFVANVNLDQLNVFGPSRDLVLVGIERTDLGGIAARVASRLDRKIIPDPEPWQGSFFRSDHFPLARAGVAAVSTGLPAGFLGPRAAAARRRVNAFVSRDYHQASDEVRDDWDYAAALDDLRLLGDFVWAIANEPSAPRATTSTPSRLFRSARARF